MRINGLKVTDAKKPLRITITKQDVKAGSKKDPTSCAAARALCRQDGVAEARVHIARTYLKTGDKWTRYATNGGLRTEIISFDRGGDFAPGKYVLTPLSPSQRTGKNHNKQYAGPKVPERGVPGKNPKKGRRSKPHAVAGIRTQPNFERM